MTTNNVQRHLTEEHKQKLSLAKKGRVSNNRGKHWKIKDSSKMGHPNKNKGKKLGKNPEHSERLKGRKLSEETKRKMSISALGKNTWSRGVKRSEEVRRKISETNKRLGSHKRLGIRRGAANYNWKGGITPVNQKIRTSLEYKIWRRAVFERDSFTCIWCGDNKGGNLNADHIKPFALYPELRFAIDNGRTLCVKCHKTTDTYGSKTRSLPITI